MVVSTAFKSFTSASNVFLCFLVWYYSGFVNNIFYKAFVVQGTGVYDLQLQVGVSLILGVLWSALFLNVYQWVGRIFSIDLF